MDRPGPTIRWQGIRRGPALRVDMHVALTYWSECDGSMLWITTPETNGLYSNRRLRQRLRKWQLSGRQWRPAGQATAMDDDALAHFDLSHPRAKFVDVIQECERVAAPGNPWGARWAAAHRPGHHARLSGGASARSFGCGLQPGRIRRCFLCFAAGEAKPKSTPVT